jgi:collagen type VII alpha
MRISVIAVLMVAGALTACGSSSSNSKGSSGATGSSGSTGSSGATGSSGSTGSSGATGSSGSTGSSGAAGSSGATSSNNSKPPLHTVGACDNLPAAGTWEDITPAALNSQNWCTPDFGSDPKSCGQPEYVNPNTGTTATYGAHTVALDPNTAGTAYLGTSSLGIWKTLDCGSTWVKIDTGAGGSDLDTGRQWTFVVDPIDSQVLYTTPGYGLEGFYKSTDGGVNFTQMFPAALAASLIYGGFIEKISIDPADHLHLTVTFHGDCRNAPSGGHACTDGQGGANCWACIAETVDGAMSWKPLTNSAQGWSEGDGQTILSGSTWLYGDYGGNGTTGGIWRTTDAGATWTQVYTGSASGAALTAKDGTYYVAGAGGLLHSTDGITWTPVPGSPGGNTVNGALFIADSGTHLYASGGQYSGDEPATGWYESAPDSDPTTWTPAFNYTAMVQGGSTLAYDPDHHLLYSSNLTTGLWRVVVP